MREETQLRIIKEVLETYSKKEPFSKHLKRFFYRNRQLGSRDRRVIQHFSYNYFRIGKAMVGEAMETKLAVANYLCNHEETPMLKYLLEKDGKLSGSTISKTLEEKVLSIKYQVPSFKFQSIFPFQSELSAQIEAELFLHSFLTQPKLWIRIRGNYLKLVEAELNEKEIEFGKLGDDTHCLYLKNSTSLDNLESFKKGYFEVQDRSSQQTIHSIQPKPGEYWWDACSGAGGKSLMMVDAVSSHLSLDISNSRTNDKDPITNDQWPMTIYATDVRESVLENLKERFTKAKVKGYRAEKIDVADLPGGFILPTGKPLDGIVADVPCTGSGTWARTPEWLEMFESSSIAEFQTLQRKIVTNLLRFLPAGKPLVYITCSVFKSENEDNVKYFVDNLHVSVENIAYIRGFIHGADTLFVARLVRSH